MRTEWGNFLWFVVRGYCKVDHEVEVPCNFILLNCNLRYQFLMVEKVNLQQHFYQHWRASSLRKYPMKFDVV
jgi:hypothetical protein